MDGDGLNGPRGQWRVLFGGKGGLCPGAVSLCRGADAAAKNLKLETENSSPPELNNVLAISQKCAKLCEPCPYWRIHVMKRLRRGLRRD